MFECLDTSPVNYENFTTALDRPETKEMLQLFGTVLHTDIENQLKIQKESQKTEVEQLCDGLVFYRPYGCYSLEMCLEKTEELSRYGTPVLTPFMADGKPVAYVSESYAISNTSENKQNAWNFIKLALSSKMQAANSCSVRKESLALDLAPARIRASWDAEKCGVGYDELFAWHRSLRENVGKVHFLSKSTLNIVEQLLPYMEGEKPFDAVYEDLQNYMKIYLSE